MMEQTDIILVDDIDEYKINLSSHRDFDPCETINKCIMEMCEKQTFNMVEIEKPKYKKLTISKKEARIEANQEMSTGEMKVYDKSTIKQKMDACQVLNTKVMFNCNPNINSNDDKIEISPDKFKKIINSNKTQLEMWPELTLVKCWHCCQQFGNMPIGIPHDYIDGIYHLYGNFCTPQCALAFLYTNKEEADSANRSTKEQYLHMIWDEYYRPILNTELFRAPPKEVLFDFGGTLSNKEYHEISMMKTCFLINRPNFVPITTEYICALTGEKKISELIRPQTTKESQQMYPCSTYALPEDQQPAVVMPIPKGMMSYGNIPTATIHEDTTVHFDQDEQSINDLNSFNSIKPSKSIISKRKALIPKTGISMTDEVCPTPMEMATRLRDSKIDIKANLVKEKALLIYKKNRS